MPSGIYMTLFFPFRVVLLGICRVPSAPADLMGNVKVTFGCTRVALVECQPQDNLGLLSP